MATREELNRSFETLEALVAERMELQVLPVGIGPKVMTDPTCWLASDP